VLALNERRVSQKIKNGKKCSNYSAIQLEPRMALVVGYIPDIEKGVPNGDLRAVTA